MKNFIYIYLLSAILLLGSCDDFIDVDPINSVRQDDFWSQKENVEAMVAASYSLLRSTIDENIYWGEIRGDLFIPGSRVNDNQENLMTGFIYLDNSYLRWSNHYRVINNVNLTLDNIKDVKSKDLTFNDSIYNLLRSEALFIRSLCYYQLACTFKDVPMPLNGYASDAQELVIPQTSQQDIFTKIIEDLTEAKNLSVSYFERIDYFKGRITTGAINALLLNVYLSLEDASKAIAIGEEIKSSNLYSIVGAEYWFRIFYPGNSEEGIFELHYDYDLSQLSFHGELLSSGGNHGADNRFLFSDYAMSLYSEFDARGDNKTFISGASSLYKFVGDKDDRVSYREDDANWIYYRYSDVLLMLAEAYIMNGDFALALDNINFLRLRRGLNNLSIDSNETDKALYYQLLLEERARELAGEGKRWFDLVRIGTYENFLYENLLVSNVLNNADAGVKPILENKLRNHDFWYLPIHESELSVNDLLVQNPYYVN